MKYVAGLIAIALVAVAVFFVVGRDDGQNNDTPNQQTESTTQESEDSTSENQPASTNKVTISNFTYSPSDITVKKGTTVTWTNNDSVSHDVVGDSDNELKSELLQNGQSYSFTFNEVGTFNYSCTPHPQMHGTVTVTE